MTAEPITKIQLKLEKRALPDTHAALERQPTQLDPLPPIRQLEAPHTCQDVHGPPQTRHRTVRAKHHLRRSSFQL